MARKLNKMTIEVDRAALIMFVSALNAHSELATRAAAEVWPLSSKRKKYVRDAAEIDQATAELLVAWNGDGNVNLRGHFTRDD